MDFGKPAFQNYATPILNTVDGLLNDYSIAVIAVNPDGVQSFNKITPIARRNIFPTTYLSSK